MCEIAQFYRQIHDFDKPHTRVSLVCGQRVEAGNKCSFEVLPSRVSWGFLPQVKVLINGKMRAIRVLNEGEVLDLSEYGCNWLCVPRASVAPGVGAQPDYFVLDMHQIFTPTVNGVGKGATE